MALVKLDFSFLPSNYLIIKSVLLKSPSSWHASAQKISDSPFDYWINSEVFSIVDRVSIHPVLVRCLVALSYPAAHASETPALVPSLINSLHFLLLTTLSVLSSTSRMLILPWSPYLTFEIILISLNLSSSKTTPIPSQEEIHLLVLSSWNSLYHSLSFILWK